MCWCHKDAKGTRMRIPDYPSNREADEMAKSHCLMTGRRQSRMKQSRETCLHNNTPGVGKANTHIYKDLYAPPPRGAFFVLLSNLFIKKYERRISYETLKTILNYAVGRYFCTLYS